MAGNFNVVYPARGRQLFDGGLNTKFERSIIAENESPSCANVVFGNGAVETCGGSSKLNTAAIGSFAFDGVYTRRDNTGAETMVVFAGGTAWQLATTTFTTIASGQSVFTAGQRVGTAQYENHLFIGNGGVTPYKYNGVAFTRHGVPAPVSSGMTGTVSATGGTFPSATYFYKVANVNSAAAIGNVSSATVGIAVGVNGSINLTGIPTAPQSHGVAARRIYRASGAAGDYGLITTLNDNTTTTFNDTYFPATATAPTDNGEPPKYNAIVAHQGRLFCNDADNPNYVWYSNIFEPYTFSVDNFQPVGDDSFDLVKGVSVYANGLVIQCERSIVLWSMPSTDPADWVLITVRSPYGSKSPYGSFLYNNRLMFAAMNTDKFVGFAALSGSTIDPEATYLDDTKAGSDLKSDRVEPDMFNVAEASVGQISATVFKNRAYITLPYGTSQTANNRVYIFDFSISNLKKQEASWSLRTGINAAQFTIYGGRLYYGSSTANGFVYQLDTTSYSDAGTAIDSYFWTKEFAGLPGHEVLQKDFRKVKLLIEKSGPYMMNVTYRVDSDAGVGTTKQINLAPGSMTWGTDLWDVGVWGSGREQDEIEVSLGQTTGKRIQFKFSNQNALNQKFKVLGLNFTYNIKGRR